MQYLKIRGSVVVLAMLLMGLPGVASATTGTSPAGTTYTGTVHAVSLGHLELHNPAANIKCTHTLHGNVIGHGSTNTLTVQLIETRLTNCTEGWTVTANSPGHLEIHHTNGFDGTVTSKGATYTAVNDAIGITCRYKTENTSIGTFTGGSPALIDINGSLPFHSGSIFCGSGASAVTGTLELASPTALYVDA